ncbi:lipopolysaccharide assembly protein LapB [Treponema sp. OMZ 788]|uniref:tetratricopeptide repeat protein n=1 Tax=Treponema sp. OMZ 788 TaxID=2563664 RepID=UPI0020A4ED36|nr:hypothetical protein [Treponema sp. OMZ 788]
MSNMKAHFYRLKFKKSILFAVFLSFFPMLFAVDYFEEGKKLLYSDKPQEAVSALFKSVQEQGSPKSVYLYLGVAYFRIGKYSDALTYLSQGKDNDLLNGHLYYYNIGNVYFLQNQFEASELAYNEAISSNGLYAPAFFEQGQYTHKIGKT